ncbi:MAG: hypothetical protein Q4G33_15465 [bacterium]|nr:hypothetical protein [bacterium]
MMTRAELLIEAKPILFNTEMVRAILDGCKTVTRRVVKHDTDAILNSPFHKENPEVPDAQIIEKLCLPRYNVGDILYVRETWAPFTDYAPCGRIINTYAYKADDEKYFHGITMKVPVTNWHPSIHMPKEAARIFLRVTEVRVERLQDITDEEAEKEGCNDYTSTACGFPYMWDNTVKKTDIASYGWNANPWVWVIEFERLEVQE